MGRRRVSLLVTDLDNTLWDWFAMWHASFSALLSKLSEISGIDAAVLEPEIRAIHQARGTSEYSHLVQEIPSLTDRYGPDQILDVFDDAIHAYRSERKRVLALYPGVRETLLKLRGMGVTIAAYTESLAFYSAYRLRALELDGIIEYLYSPPDHDFPLGVSVEDMRSSDAVNYELQQTVHHHTPSGVLKPEPSVLQAVVSELGTPATTAYVGDSLMKDVAMAQAVGVADVHAGFGEVGDGPEYELLRRVSHWTDSDVERERELAARPEVVPSYVLDESFDEILELFEFGES